MTAILTDEQRQLREVTRALAARLALRDVPAPDDGPPSSGREWAELATHDYLGLAVATEHGGSGASTMDLALVVETLAHELVPGPHLGGAVLAPHLLSLAGAPGDLMDAIISGRTRLSIALDGRLASLATGPEVAGVGWDVDGADEVLCLLEGTEGEVQVMRTPIVDAPAIGSVDVGRRLVELRGMPAGEPVGVVSRDALDRWTAFARVMLAAEMTGLMAGVLGRAVAHATDRHQFGQPIGSFQAIQHLCAEAEVTLEIVRSATWYAAWAVDTLDPAQSRRPAMVAKELASRHSIGVIEDALQVFGGIGMTWELTGHVALRRALLDARLLGNSPTLLVERGRELMAALVPQEVRT